MLLQFFKIFISVNQIEQQYSKQIVSLLWAACGVAAVQAFDDSFSTFFT